jgi:hypothetical protein
MTDSALVTTVPAPEREQVRPFPTMVGILLGSSLCLHLAAVVYYASGATLNAAISVFRRTIPAWAFDSAFDRRRFRFPGRPAVFHHFLFSLRRNTSDVRVCVWRRHARHGRSGFHVRHGTFRIQFRPVVVQGPVARCAEGRF